MASDLGALVERCRQGDALAWERLVRRCQGRVYGLAYHYLGDVEGARDLTQEVFVRVYQQLGTYEGDGFMAWLLRITRNLCIDQIRRRKARPQAEDLLAEENEWAMPDTAPDAEQSWLTDGKKRLVYDALRRLNGPSREMILLKEIQGLPAQGDRRDAGAADRNHQVALEPRPCRARAAGGRDRPVLRRSGGSAGMT